MMIESIVILMIGWSNVLGVQYLLPIHKQKQFTMSVTIGAVVNIVLNIPFISLWGLNGSMWATVLSETNVTLYQLIAVRGLLSYKKLFNSSWKYLISGIVMFVPIFWMNRNLRDTWLMMGLEVLVGVIIYVVMVLLLRAPVVGEVKKIVKNKLCK